MEDMVQKQCRIVIDAQRETPPGTHAGKHAGRRPAAHAMKRGGLATLACLVAVWADISVAGAQPVIPGSTAFCLYEVPQDENGRRRWINLGIVQYVEATQTEVKIFYGAGSFGSGHEARIPVTGMEAALQVLEKMRRVAAACR